MHRRALQLSWIALAVSLAAGAAVGADPFYFGAWKIDSAVAGPWVDAPFPDDTAQMQTLVGKTIVVSAKGIKGPSALACTAPQYAVIDTGPEYLFEGGLDEAHRNGKADAQTLAAGLGFRGSSWKTLDTGCENELQLHFVDERTAEFGLNNYVYTLKKQ
jgi:hypothetical protein